MQMQSIVILGGGTSGWMMACALAKHTPDINVTLVESQTLGTIGVGEGTTPYFKRFMQSLGIQEQDWMPQCDASFKAGIYFDNWNGKNDRYFHPFYSGMDEKTAEVFFVNANARRRGGNEQAIPDDYFLTGHIARNHYSPKATSHLPKEQEYGYHFDATKLSRYLSNYAKNLGVTHYFDDFKSAKQASSGDIKHIEFVSGLTLTADMYIDASGFNALLIEKTLGIEFESFSDQLLNDSAIAVATPIESGSLPSATVSKSLNAGWCWKIPLTSRFGNGYVYSSQHLTPDDAQHELANELGINPLEHKFKHLKMRVGKSQVAWKNNVLAIGLSQSFIEPIEATALMVTQFTIDSFISLLKNNKQSIEYKQHSLNTTLDTLIDGIKDYVIAHYITSKRHDTEYWQKATDKRRASPLLLQLIEHWLSGQDIDAFLHQNHRSLAYFRPSWYCLLAGMDVTGDGIEKPSKKADLNIENAAKTYLDDLCKSHFEPHWANLEVLRK